MPELPATDLKDTMAKFYMTLLRHVPHICEISIMNVFAICPQIQTGSPIPDIATADEIKTWSYVHRSLKPHFSLSVIESMESKQISNIMNSVLYILF